MSEELSFDQLMDQDLAVVKRPPPLPSGTYTVVIKNCEQVKSSQKGTDGFRMTYGIQSSEGDVNPDELAAFLEDESLEKKEIGDSFWMTPKSAFMLKEFLAKCGKPTGAGMTFRQALKDIVGTVVKAKVAKKPNRKGDGFYNEIEDYIPV